MNLAELRGKRKGLGPSESAAFHWMHYTRWRLVKVLKESDNRPLSFPLAKRIAIWSTKADAIREIILIANAGLAYKVAGYIGPCNDDEYEDWVQEAMIHMARLAERFDPSRHLRFSTYVYLSLMRRLSQLKGKRVAVQGREQRTPERWLLEGDSPHVLDELAAKELRELLDANVAGLTERELLVLRHRFGFHTGGKETLNSVSKVLGCTRERVRQIQAAGMDKLAAVFDPNS